ncbi:MAG: hypothetical protein QOF26_4174 [Baekduia sp.]|jgi:hypothetical protein|nr:hypothetical protein [Baekduia sp.]
MPSYGECHEAEIAAPARALSDLKTHVEGRPAGVTGAA